MALHTPESHVPGNPGSGLRPDAGNPGPANPGPGNPAPQVQRTGNPILAGAGNMQQEVIANYMTLTPPQKRRLLTAFEGELGEILLIVLPNELEEVILEAINTDPARIVDGTTPPQTGAQVAPPGVAAAPAPPGSLSSSAIPPSVNALAGFR